MRDFWQMRQALAARVQGWPGVEGLVWAGSSADTARADEWSDLDFFLIVSTGLQEGFRTDLGWLPAAEEIAWAPRETAHGLKVVYTDGFVLEFAVFDRAELSSAVVNHHALEFGDADVEQRLASIYRPAAPAEWLALDDRLGLVASLLLIGVGRYYRGERLVAAQFIRSYAIGQLLNAARIAFTSESESARDGLDVWRRVELEYPALAHRLDLAMAHEVPDVVAALLDVMVDFFGELSALPQLARQVIRARLGWD